MILTHTDQSYSERGAGVWHCSSTDQSVSQGSPSPVHCCASDWPVPISAPTAARKPSMAWAGSKTGSEGVTVDSSTTHVLRKLQIFPLDTHQTAVHQLGSLATKGEDSCVVGWSRQGWLAQQVQPRGRVSYHSRAYSSSQKPWTHRHSRAEQQRRHE